MQAAYLAREGLLRLLSSDGKSPAYADELLTDVYADATGADGSSAAASGSAGVHRSPRPATQSQYKKRSLYYCFQYF